MLSPVVMPIEVCNGLTNQRISLVQGVAQAIIVGAQVLLPLHIPSDGTEIPGIRNSQRSVPLNLIYNGDAFQESVRAIYLDYWCARPSMPQSKIWCNSEGLYDPVLKNKDAWSSVDSLRVSKSHSNWRKLKDVRSPDASQAFGQGIFREFSNSRSGWGVLDRGCTMFSLEVVEENAAWDLFWAVDSSLRFSQSVVSTARIIEAGIREGKVVGGKTPVHDSSHNQGQLNNGFIVLHLRVEPDWQLHCRNWMSLRDGVHRDNCLNNSKSIHNTLLSEGVPRLSNVYVSSGLLSSDLFTQEYGLDGLLNHFNVYTKDSVLPKPLPEAMRREWWAAVDTELSMASELFVGNSVSTFSAYILQARRKQKKLGWHYNGGGIPLADAKILSFRTSSAVETFPKQLKWVFTIHEGVSDMSASFKNMLKIAVLSARKNTNLIPVCVTTSPLKSKLNQWMTSQNVRIIYHQPSWANTIETAVQRHVEKSLAQNLSGREHSHLSVDPDAMVGTFLRIDIPILGILDEFVLYTDVDVMFTGPVTWRNILPTPGMYNRARSSNDFARGKVQLGAANAPGLPTFFSVTSEMSKTHDSNFMNAGVMLMNMRNLRESYESLLRFITEKAERTSELDWDSGPGDQGALKEFYSTTIEGKRYVHASLLPFEMNWKSYWEASTNASIVHFHGPKCEMDILPYFNEGIVAVPQFEGILKRCEAMGNCLELCLDAQSFLDST